MTIFSRDHFFLTFVMNLLVCWKMTGASYISFYRVMCGKFGKCQRLIFVVFDEIDLIVL